MTKEVLSTRNIDLNVSLANKEEGIRYVGNILVKNGYVKHSYLEKMLRRENITSTYMGNYVAIPHGTEDASEDILCTGISVVTVPKGLDYGNGNIVKILIGIAGKGEGHLATLSKIAIILSDTDNVNRLLKETSKEKVRKLFSEVN
ncbi:MULTISPECIES: PTS sugar transporter subunit IIA [Clostridia]|uniref:PTS sugar transporter subunit IIA n=1 Tax=Clostridia TaxID=186801 RepID=UPI000EA018B6|nr:MULTISPECIES: PTS sugar transporter subunit IIA [Clostridia]NBJ70822.1 PTS mannitol transporter subunit IIA [Roseburia sp. 1XD42-34]RKI75686.1 PTS mannitol transporter subunit IIA [Clostridium sp. 1xD42-85]